MVSQMHRHHMQPGLMESEKAKSGNFEEFKRR